MKLRKTRVEIEGQVHERWVVEEGHGLEPWTEGTDLAHVGRARSRVDGAERITGQAVFTADLAIPGMLHARFVRSPWAHARLEGIDSSVALEVRGVHAAADADDEEFGGIEWPGGGVLVREALFAGHEVAVVCAETPDAAEEAARRVAATCVWTVLPHHLDPREGLSETAHALAGEGNLLGGAPESYVRGDPDGGAAAADRIVEETFETSCCLHNALETHGSVAWWEGDQLVVHTSTQHVFGVRSQLAGSLGIPLGRVQVRSPYMGGGFGAKNNAGKPDLAAGVLARRTRRPVRCILDRAEENLAAGNRPPSIQRVRIGARKDGTLTLLDLEAWTGIGAWAGWGTPVAGPLRTLYACPNVRTRVYHVRTHTGPQAAFRAPGYVEGCFALEQAMDMLAAELDLDPLELRRRNHAGEDQVSGNAYSSKGLLQAYTEGAEAFGWESRQSRRDPAGARRRRGFGCASQIWGGGGGPPAYATVQLQPDGTALVSSGTQDLGTGTKTVLTQIAAEELGISESDIRVELGDTRGPYAPLSAGSMTVASVGPAVRAAAAEARENLIGVAAKVLNRDPSRLRVHESAILEGAEKLARVRDVTAELGNVMIFGRGSRGPNPDGRVINTFGCHFAEVEVDIWTGRVRIERYVAAHDSGRIVNPLTAGSQVQGGVLQGASGLGLMESRHMDPAAGCVLAPGLESYKVPTVADAPEVDVRWVDPGDTDCNPLGVKGVGEPPIIPAAAAVANAVADALGVRVRASPLSPQNILEALAESEEG